MHTINIKNCCDLLISDKVKSIITDKKGYFFRRNQQDIKIQNIYLSNYRASKSMKQKQTDNKTAGIYREIHSVIRYFNLSHTKTVGTSTN